jgi:hypothetical protein
LNVDKGQIFVLAIIAITMMGGILKMSIRAKHGLPLEDRHSRRARRHGLAGSDDIEAQRKIDLLSGENERLTGQIGRLEERLRVLERIATDPAERVAREIDELRSRD